MPEQWKKSRGTDIIIIEEISGHRFSCDGKEKGNIEGFLLDEKKTNAG